MFTLPDSLTTFDKHASSFSLIILDERDVIAAVSIIEGDLMKLLSTWNLLNSLAEAFLDVVIVSIDCFWVEDE